MEKTFEEILEDYMAYNSMTETQKLFVKKMMMKVREATKWECYSLTGTDYIQTTISIEKLPIDRIRIEP